MKEENIEIILSNCSQLKNEEFIKKFPGINNVAGFLGSAARTSYSITGSYIPFDRLGVRTIPDFLTLVENGDIRAIRLYSDVKEILRF